MPFKLGMGLGVTAVGGGGFSPRQLNPLAWYDVHLAGTPGQTVADQMGGTAATLGSTAGSDTNDPLWLQNSGTDYLYLTGTAGNSLTCTAPAGTANYRTTDNTGTQATSAASAGAFTFSTTGSWASVELLNGSSTVIAKFTASLSAQSGFTDSFGVAWTVNRSASGPKAALVKGRGVLLLGTDDYLQLPVGANPSMTATDNWTMLTCLRQWPTPSTGFDRYMVNLSSAKGVQITANGTAASVYADLSSTSTVSPATVSFTFGQIVIAGMVCSAGGTLAATIANTIGSTSNVSALGDRTGGATRIGTSLGGTTFADIEVIAVMTFSRALSASELASLVSYYQAGV